MKVSNLKSSITDKVLEIFKPESNISKAENGNETIIHFQNNWDAFYFCKLYKRLENGK